MTKISVSYGTTKNMGNYESMRIDASKERDLLTNEEHGKAFDAILSDLKIIVDAAVDNLKCSKMAYKR